MGTDASKVSWLPDAIHTTEASMAILEVGTTLQVATKSHHHAKYGFIGENTYLIQEILTRIQTKPERAGGVREGSKYL